MKDEAKLTNFLFSLKRLPEAEKDLDLQMQALEARIDKLVKGVEVNHVPILAHLLQLSHDKEELEKLGKALLRVAPLVEQHDDLAKRKSVFELATKEPNWLAWAFGDFSDEVDTFTDTILPKD